MGYPGGKGKCYQHIINAMPPHDLYIETHLGGGAVLRNKRPARRSIGVDIDSRVISNWKNSSASWCELVCGDAVEFLLSYPFRADELVYADPPYLPETRRRGRIYRHEYTESEHIRLLTVLVSLPCRVMVSGYPSRLYDEHLRGWFYKEFAGVSQAGRRTEALWTNFFPVELHDYRFVGENFRERERIQRKQQRWCSRLRALPAEERRALLSAIHELERELL